MKGKNKVNDDWLLIRNNGARMQYTDIFNYWKEKKKKEN